MKKILPIIMTAIMVMTLSPSAIFAGISEDGSAYVLEEDETWDSENFAGDVYITQDHTLTTTGETTILGDVYNFGTLNNTGSLKISGTLNCLYYVLNGITMSAGNYDHGKVFSEGSLDVGTLNVKDDFLSAPIPEVHKHSYGEWTTVEAAGCTDKGCQVRECVKCGYTESREVAAKGHSYKTVTVKATTSANGSVKVKCSSCGAVKSSDTIYKPTKFTLSKTSVTYTGKAISPTVTVKDSKGRTLKKNTDYKVAYSSNKSVGKAFAKITFKGKYSGTKTLSFKINPKGTVLSKVTGGNKSFTAKWKKQTTQTTGYQIKYSTSSKFTNSKTKLVSGNKKVSKTIKGLKAGKKYYVSIRTYKTVKGVKYYSGWSKAKIVKTKGVVSKPSASVSSNTVYITETGSKYHYNKNCRGLSNANRVIPTTLSKAKAGGYTLCGYED